MKTITILFLAGACAFAQPQTFEAVSIKPASPGAHRTRMIGGPGTADPGLFTCKNCSLQMLVMNAFNIKPYQLTGPAWMNDERFDIGARVPKNAGKAEFLEMQVNLLKDRFGLTIHRETKEVPTYTLVAAKGSPKLKESAQNRSGVLPEGAPKIGSDGFPTFPMTDQLTMVAMNGRLRAQGSNQTVQQIATMLSTQAGRPVTDATHLPGKYDVKLSWTADNLNAAPAPASDDMPLPTLLDAVQEQLGLKLEATRGPVDIIVVNHIDKTPTPN